jgi:hypothetical protein
MPAIGEVIHYVAAPGVCRAAMVTGTSAQIAAALEVQAAQAAEREAQTEHRNAHAAYLPALAAVKKQRECGGVAVLSVEDAQAVITLIETERKAADKEAKAQAKASAAQDRLRAALEAQKVVAATFDLQVFTNGQDDWGVIADRYQPTLQFDAIVPLSVYRRSVEHDATGKRTGTWHSAEETHK